MSKVHRLGNGVPVSDSSLWSARKIGGLRVRVSD